MDTPAPIALTITATELKAKCLDLLDRIAGHEIESVTITKRGRVVGILRAPTVARAEPRALWGCLAGTVSIDPALDLTQPVIEMRDEHGELPAGDAGA